VKCELQNSAREAGACTYRPDDIKMIHQQIEIKAKHYADIECDWKEMTQEANSATIMRLNSTIDQWMTRKGKDIQYSQEI
jgi:hypothetical protein